MNKKIIFLIVLSSIVLLFIGFTTQIYLGDETYHFRLAKIIYETSQRPILDPVYKDFPKISYFNTDTTLWHILLGYFWKIIGNVSKYTAQLYQLFYFLIIIFSLYFLAKKIYDKKIAFYSLLILITIPSVVFFSILLYIDIPLAALTTLCFFLIFTNRYILAGIILGLAIFTKINTFFLIPSIILLVFIYTKEKISIARKFINLFKIGVPAFLINLPDIYFRHKNFNYIYYPNIMHQHKGMNYYYSPGAVTINPLFLIIYLGLPLLLGIVLYFVFSKYEKKDSFLWIPVISYLIFWFIFFKNVLDARYLIPILPFLTIIAAKAINHLKNKRIIIVFILICVLQFMLVCGFTYIKRQIPEGIREGYDFINKNIPKNAVLMYPGEDIVTYTNRPIAYGRIWKIAEMYWAKDDITIYNILKEYSVDYIIIKKSRIYDDSKVRHIGGYPFSFVEKLPKLNFLKNIFDNKELTIYKVIK
ncbi:MAG: glycosyltransferase family 39 protein [Candidatus Omnitrophota bacterium]